MKRPGFGGAFGARCAARTVLAIRDHYGQVFSWGWDFVSMPAWRSMPMTGRCWEFVMPSF
jgi:hypothetical protein